MPITRSRDAPLRTAAPPAADEGTTEPRVSEKETVASEKGTVAPPAAEKRTVVPRVSEKGIVAPPAAEKRNVVPRASEKRTERCATEMPTASTSSGTYKTDTTSITFGSTATEVSEKTTTTTSEQTTTTEGTEQIQDKKKLATSTRTLVPVNRTARSKRTSSSTIRRKELEAKEELARKQLEEANAATKLAQVRLELAQLEESDDSVEEDEEDGTERVQDWIKASQLENATGDPLALKAEEVQPSNSASIEIKTLAEAIKQAITPKEGYAPPPKYMHELPPFDGNSGEWLAFKTVYEDTAPMFSETQNMARLRKSIKGNARETFKSLLYSDASPDEMIEALRRRYGRPEALAIAELDKIKALPRISDSAKDICLFASQINNSVAAIRGLKKPQYLHSPEMMKQIVEKLPPIVKFRWYDYANEMNGDFSDLNTVAKFLNKEADKCGAFATEEKSYRRTPYRHSTHTTIESRRPMIREKSCPECKDEHSLHECPQFANMSIQQRWDTVMKLHLCFKCLSGRHRKDQCKRPSCKICKRWHHYLLHAEKTPEATKNIEEETVRAPVNTIKEGRAYLKMAPVEVYGPKGSKKILALLDEGSTISLLDSRVAEEIGAAGKKQELVLETVGGKLLRNENSMKLNLKIKGVHQEDIKSLDKVHTIEDLKLSPQFLDKKRIEDCSHLKGITSVVYYEPEPPLLLIGQDNWELITTKGIKKGRPGQPVASLTELGWVLHGCDSKGARSIHVLNTCMHLKQVDQEMHDTIKEHFTIESLGVQPKRPKTDLEGRALSILEQTCRRLEDGRFEAGLLWKNEQEKMPESYTSAERRLKNTEKKIDRDPELKKEYGKQIQHLLDSKYAEEAPAVGDPEKTWYLPHFSVIHPLKKKVRIVFDAAAKSNRRSLNDALLSGPDLLQSLFGVLLRFRQGPLAVAADIKEMFLQIRIRPEDRDSLRFLWRGEQRDVTPKVYRMTSVIFGASSSPTTAIYVKNRNAADFEEKYPEAVKAIERNHYMDDYLHSHHSEEELKKRIKEIDFIHKQAGFELRGWASNNPQLLQEVTKETKKKEVSLGEKEEKTLGLRWLTETDEIAFRTNLRNTPEEVINEEKIPTKRQVTSAVMSTFDPLGLASPVLIQGKRLLQSIWRSGVGWDDEVQDKENDAWRNYLSKLELLKSLHIPRCIAPQRTEGELHTFTDASELAYSAAVYWRAIEEDGSVQLSLVAGKARVTPLKPVSVPRLELQAALLGSRLAHSVEVEMDLEVKKKTFWTDSSVVLSWIKTDPRTFKTFVAHRLAEIEDLTRPQDWRWVPTAQNPADDATRQVPEHFSREHRWFTGPDFLRNQEDSWPAKRSFKKERTGEEKEMEATAKLSKPINHACPDPNRFSSWTRLWRATARVLQFIELCRRKERVNVSKRREKEDPTWGKRKQKIKTLEKIKPGIQTSPILKPLEEEHLQKAELVLLKRSQQESFGEDLEKSKPNLQLKKLDVEMKDGLIRLRGRIDAIENIAYDYKRPIVLDSKNKIVRLLIEEYHKKFNHGNHATVMNELQQRFLIFGLRSAIRKMAHQCLWCRMKKATPSPIPTGDLPPERLNYGELPFTCTGVDYFGPMTVTVGRRREKRWGALFTCLTTRAVHLELTPSLSTDSMIMALRRFAARRGMPKTLWSDNGTNFVGADKELRASFETMKSELIEQSQRHGVRWKFIPPGAPNMGGAWERLVQSVKTALKATLNEQHPREEVLHTLLLEAEHIVNSRPLTHLIDNTEEEALTPNHFLIGRSCGATRIGTFSERDLVGRHTWRTVQKMADHFWARWLREYLPTLLQRKGCEKEKTTLRVGDIVLIVDSNLPRCTWPRGRITDVHPGPDGRVRVVHVETSHGTLRRPSSRVVLLLPAESPDQMDGASHEGETDGDQ